MNSNKLKLRLDELAVQSFATSYPRADLGTVVGYSTPLTIVEATAELCPEIITETEEITDTAAPAPAPPPPPPPPPPAAGD